jgi:hypothetical protein
MVVGLIPVQKTINQLGALRGAKPDASFQRKHVPVFVVGGIFVLLMLLGVFLPAD